MAPLRTNEGTFDLSLSNTTIQHWSSDDQCIAERLAHLTYKELQALHISLLGRDAPKTKPATLTAIRKRLLGGRVRLEERAAQLRQLRL